MLQGMNNWQDRIMIWELETQNNNGDDKKAALHFVFQIKAKYCRTTIHAPAPVFRKHVAPDGPIRLGTDSWHC